MICLRWSLLVLLFPGLQATTLQALATNVVVEWNALAIDAIRIDDTGPTLSTRNLAILHTSIYDAVNSIERKHQTYQFQIDPAGSASPEAAAVSAVTKSAMVWAIRTGWIRLLLKSMSYRAGSWAS